MVDRSPNPSVDPTHHPGMPSGWRDGRIRAQERGGSGAQELASRGRILVVEDEYFVALDAEHALTTAGFSVVGIVATTEEAIDLAWATRPDLVLMDIRLASLRDGIDAAAEILRDLGIPSLFATAHSDPGTRARGEAASSPVGWLNKPYTHRELVAAVSAGIREARRRSKKGGGEA